MITELNVEIEELISRNADDFQISKVFKTYFKQYVESIDVTVDTTGGKDFFVKHTKQTDKFLITLYKYILRKHFGSYQPMSSAIPISLVALGSYGREQLCIYSDVDLMILYEDIKGYNLKTIMEEFITLAWDCGLKLGSRVHEIKDVVNVVKEDITIKTSIIESRLIYGSKQLWFSYENVLTLIRKTHQANFVDEKNEEHLQRLQKYPLKMQPNIKDGYGGMREANMVFWMANVIYGVSKLKDLLHKQFNEEEYHKYRISLEYIFQVRNHLHNIAKKKLDVVNFDVLPELSTKMGYKNTPRLTKERQAMATILQALHNVHFFTTVMAKKFTRVVQYKKENYRILKACRYKKNLFIHESKLYTSFNAKPKTLTTVLKELLELPNTVQHFDRSYIYQISKTIMPTHQSKEHKRLIRKLLYKESLYAIIKLLYNARIFQSILPVAKKIIDQPQFDGYHELPVDVHSIYTLKKLRNIQDDYVKNIYENMDETSQAITRIATFFHDIGKGRQIDHHEAGEKLFKGLAKSLEFDPIHNQMIAKLIRYHNIMSQVATNEDIYSEKVILNFSGVAKSKHFLDMLYVMTYADIAAVGENIYNSSTATLLKELYTQSIPAFGNKELLSESARRVAKQNSIKNLKKYKELSNLMKKKISYISSNQIFLQLKAADILDLAIKARDVNNYIYKIVNEEVLTIRIIRAVPLNLGYLLGKLEFLNIVSMNIFKLYDDKKCFEVTFSEKIDEADLYFVKEVVENAFDMTLKTKLNPACIKDNELLIDCNHTSYLASMKVKTKDQKGLLAYIAKVFDDFNVEIESAKLYTSRGKARDLFLIEKNGNFCANSEEIKQLLCQPKS
jgi:[protein-PII] uridylyltransferase